MWILIALVCAFLTGTSDALAKRLLAGFDERVVGWARLLFSLPWLLLFPLATGWPALGGDFWRLMGVLVPLEMTAYLCYLRAIRIAPLSQVSPFLAFTPLLAVLNGWLFLGEKVSGPGFAGVAAVTAGAYILQAAWIPHGLLEPIRSMFRVRGIRLTLAAAALYSLTVTLGKRAISLSSPTAFPFLYFSIDTLALTPIAFHYARESGGIRAAVKAQFPLYLLSGLVTAAAFFTHCLGIPRAPVAYFVAIKRLSLLVSVLYGGLLFREEAFRERLVGTFLMLSGAILITLTARW